LYDVLQKTHKDFEVQFDALFASTPKPWSTPETTKISTSNGCDRWYNIDIDTLCAKSQHFNIEQVVVESCDEAIDKENNALKLEVKVLEQKVKVLEKQFKVQLSQDNRRNMMNKLEKWKTMAKLAPQQQKRHIHHKKEERTNIDEKIEYAWRVFLNEGHTSKMALVTKLVSSTTREWTQIAKSSSSSPRATFIKIRTKASATLTILLMLMLLIFLICLIMILMYLMFLWETNLVVL
jgi:hypothetical protein